LAYASISAAQSLLDNRTAWNTSGWMWSPLLDEFTFVPRSGLLMSPFGWQFWSPVNLGYYYTPAYYYPGATSGVSAIGSASGLKGVSNPSAAATAVLRGRPVAVMTGGSGDSGWQAGSRSAGGFSNGSNSGGFSGNSGGFSGNSAGSSGGMRSGGAAPAVMRSSGGGGSGRATQIR
jgi:hypothetical protein